MQTSLEMPENHAHAAHANLQLQDATEKDACLLHTQHCCLTTRLKYSWIFGVVVSCQEASPPHVLDAHPRFNHNDRLNAATSGNNRRTHPKRRTTVSIIIITYYH